MNYYEKYIKYKNKYLQLKGGAPPDINDPEQKGYLLYTTFTDLESFGRSLSAHPNINAMKYIPTIKFTIKTLEIPSNKRLEGILSFTDEKFIVENLVIKKKDISDYELIQLLNKIDKTQLKSLDLYNCSITDNGLSSLAKLISLQNLNLEYCYQINDDGLQYLTNLTSLYNLNISNCYKLTNDGLNI